MKTLFSFLLTLLFTRGALAAAPERMRIAFDMNGVTMGYQGPTTGFGEMIEILLRDPRVEIYFYSTQGYRGVEGQLKSVRLPDGRTADQVAKIIDGTRMTDMDVTSPENDRFDVYGPRRPMRRKPSYKDLRVISPDPIDLANTVLVDDDDYKSHPDQLDHLLWVPTDLGRPVYSPPRYEPPAYAPPPRIEAPRAYVPEDKQAGYWSDPLDSPADPGPLPQTRPPAFNSVDPYAAPKPKREEKPETVSWWTKVRNFVAERPEILPELSRGPARRDTPAQRPRAPIARTSPTPSAAPSTESAAPDPSSRSISSAPSTTPAPSSRAISSAPPGPSIPSAPTEKRVRAENPVKSFLVKVIDALSEPEPTPPKKAQAAPKSADPYEDKSSYLYGPPRAREPAPRSDHYVYTRPERGETNDRSNLMLGALHAAIVTADRRKIPLADALRDIVWLPEDPKRPGAHLLRLDRKEVTQKLIAHGERVRARAKCEFRIVPEKRSFW